MENELNKSEIHIEVSLDTNRVPELISWQATDAEAGSHDARAILLALWDGTAQNGMSINLWTKEMTVPEMNIFVYQSLLSMSESFFSATQNKEVSDDLKKFAQQFFEKISAEKP